MFKRGFMFGFVSTLIGYALATVVVPDNTVDKTDSPQLENDSQEGKFA